MKLGRIHIKYSKVEEFNKCILYSAQQYFIVQNMLPITKESMLQSSAFTLSLNIY